MIDVEGAELVDLNMPLGLILEVTEEDLIDFVKCFKFLPQLLGLNLHDPKDVGLKVALRNQLGDLILQEQSSVVESSCEVHDLIIGELFEQADFGWDLLDLVES